MQFKIPLFKLNYNRQEEKAVLKTIRSKWLSIGPKSSEFEEKFAREFSVSYALTTSSCTTALHLALKAVGIQENDEVIVPSLTFVATVNVVRYMGAIPVFCDITRTDHLNLNAEQIRKLITKKTRGIIVMHYAGFPCDMDAICSIAKEYNLKIIEDACHAPLSQYKNKTLGTIGDIGCFSFFSNKNISTGEGGMLITNNETYYNQIKLLRSHGMTTLSYERSKGHSTTYDVIELGYNYRMDDIRSALGIVQLKKLPADLKKREMVRKIYIEHLQDNPQIIIPFLDNTYFVSNYIFPIVLKDSDYQKRDKVREYLHQKGIQTSVHYPAVHRFKINQDIKCSLPVTEYVADNLITLPMYGDLKLKEINYICKTLNTVLKTF
jgi:dTDP-4-amino-4,6-dideoxygalactose transaminase